MNEFSPVIIFTYLRINHLKKTIESLKKNKDSCNTVLYVVSDGPACAEHIQNIQKLRDYIDDIKGFREVIKIYREKNLGPYKSPILAENAVVNDHGSVISLEDDNITSSNFLSYMNQGLKVFESNEQVYSICAYIPNCINKQKNDEADFWLYPWNLSWGYAVHKNKYNLIHPLVNKYTEHKKSGLLRKQNNAGGLYVSDSLFRDFKKQKPLADSILATEMFSRGLKSVLPTISKIDNIGQDGSGQSTSIGSKKYETKIDASDKYIFDFTFESNYSNIYNREMNAFHNGSIVTRAARHLKFYNELEVIKKNLNQLRFL